MQHVVWRCGQDLLNIKRATFTDRRFLYRNDIPGALASIDRIRGPLADDIGLVKVPILPAPT